AQFGIIERIGANHPGGAVGLRKIFRQISPGHQMKTINLHNIPDRGFGPFERFERFSYGRPAGRPYGFHPAFFSADSTSAAMLRSNTSWVSTLRSIFLVSRARSMTF